MNVLVDKQKLDILANAISDKSGEPVTMTLAEMVEAVDGIEAGITPTGSVTITQNGQTDVTQYATANVQVPQPSGNIDITQAGVIDVTDYATATVPSASLGPSQGSRYISGNYLYSRFSWPDFIAGYLSSHGPVALSQLLQNETVTPSSAVQTITPTSYAHYLESVIVNPIPSQYIVPSGTYTVDSSGTKDVTQYASASIPSGTEGTPSATKGTVSNHSVSVTPSVTNTAGWISGGTKTGTAVTVSASELVSGSQTVATNGTYNVTNFAELIVNVPNVDCPVFTGVYDDSVVRMNSCSMTFSECTALVQSGKKHAFLDMTAGAQVHRVPMVCDSLGGALRYNYNESAGFSFSVTYNSDGTITYAEPSATTTLFTVSQSGNNQTDSAGRLIGAVSVPAGTAGTPTATKGQVSNAQVTVTPSVTNSTGWINGGTKNGSSVTVTAQELVAGNTLYADDSGNWAVANVETLVIPDASSTVSATKGTVSNHSVSVTPRVVTSSHGWTDTGTVTGSPVTVSASELVSGSQTITQNGTVDVTNLAEVVVAVEGGGGSGDGYVWQDAQGYVHLSDEEGTPATLVTKTITANGTYDAEDDNANGYSSVTVNVPSGGGGSSDFKAFIERSTNTPTLPSDLTTIGAFTFYQWANLTLTSLPNSVTSIGSNAFQGCTGLALTSLPSGLVSIGNAAFYGCTNLTLTSLPNSVTSIGSSAFLTCTNITSMSCNGRITTLGASAFTGTSSARMNLESVRFPYLEITNMSTVFGATSSASACQKLEFADLGTIATISANAFSYCYALQTLVLRKTGAVTNLSNVSAFSSTPMSGYNSMTGTVYVPSALISSYRTATNWSTLYNNGTVNFVAIEGSEYEL